MNFIGSLFKFFIVDVLGSVLYFPVWWYTEGFFEIVNWVKRGLSYRWRAYSFSVWMKNFLVPMYGQYDFAGRVVSVFMRFIVLIGRGIAFIAEAFGYLVIVGIWLLLPAFSFLFFFLNIFQGLAKLI